MGLTVEQIHAISELVLTEPTLLEAAVTWRKRYPDVRVIRLTAAEISDEKPFIEFRGRRVYLATWTGVCIDVTTDAARADMLILAEEAFCDGD
ncbi:hypothetical protein ACLKMY_38825 [Paraburkholderia mimosarum]|uniref:hypothetical protein n=1 Tax=Paraburkholderia mimosarum TaxID=312026 RepID=UPI000480EE1C|nr:hypothetical protein [Paraburkholderia mimosarum]